MNSEISIKIAGEAGQGINVSALTLAKAFTKKGYHVFLLTDNPNSIKLEPASCTLRVSESPLTSHTHKVDMLACLFKGDIERHHAEVSPNGYVIFDPETVKFDPNIRRQDISYLEIPLSKLIKEKNFPELLKNTIVVGAILSLVDYNPAIMEALIKDQFLRKGEELVRQNIEAFETGFNFIKNNSISCDLCRIARFEKSARMLINGNEALSLGAIKAGCKFLSAYPMTPSSAILHYLAAKAVEYRIVVKHTEDEIAAMNMAIGANYAGARGMTCTSGGGFALMTEALGMAGQSETPVVVVVGQRPGPSTGQPTHTSQGDLRFLIHASQGEFPRIVIAPGDINECFFDTFNAFNLAEIFQLPVLILTDKYLVESYITNDEFSDKDLKITRGKLLSEVEAQNISDYKRYVFASDGISPRAIPSQPNCLHLATSYEHDEYGYYGDDTLNAVKMMDKRFSKLKLIEEALPKPKLYGPVDAELTIIAWGSTKGSILEAMEMLKKENIIINFLHIVYIWPFPKSVVEKTIKEAKLTLGIEANKTGQMMGLIKENTGFDLSHQYLKYDGQPFCPVDIYNKAKEILR